MANAIFERILEPKPDWDTVVLFIRGLPQPVPILAEQRNKFWKIERGCLIMPVGTHPSPIFEGEDAEVTKMISEHDIAAVSFLKHVKKSIIEPVPGGMTDIYGNPIKSENEIK